ncbi:unnamed protein product, partial [Staurois parvus]
MLLPGPVVSHGSLYGLPLLPVSIATLCHVPLSGLLTLLVCSILFCHRVLADYGSSPLLLPGLNLPWAPVPKASSMLLPRSTVLSWVPVPPPIAAVSHRHTLPCATFRSPHTAGVLPFFV